MFWSSANHPAWILWPHLIPHSSPLTPPLHLSLELLVCHPWNISLISWHFLGALAHHYVVSITWSQHSSLSSLHWSLFWELGPATGHLLYFVQLNSQMNVFQLTSPSFTMQDLLLLAAPTGWTVLLSTSSSRWEVTPPFKHCMFSTDLFGKLYVTLVSIGTWISWTFIFA